MSDQEEVIRYYEALGKKYIDPKNRYFRKYHALRLQTAKTLLSRHRASNHLVLFDFGCGSGELFEAIADMGFEIRGCDITPKMVELARGLLDRLGIQGDLTVGGLDALTKIERGGVDVLVSLNVLPYLTQDEEEEFFRQAKRVLSIDGLLLVSHANELFDLVTFNRYTVEFFAEKMLPTLELSDSEAEEALALFKHLLRDPEYPPCESAMRSERDVLNKRRSDPFTYPDYINGIGFERLAMEFLGCFPLPPSILRSRPRFADAQLESHNHVKSETLKRIFSSQYQMLFRNLS